MTRKEQVFFCAKCTNRKMHSEQGLICKLTEAQATFQEECPDFILDDTVKKVVYDESLNEPFQQLPPEISDRLKMEQKLIPGILSGVIAGIAGALLWGVITVVTEFQIGFMAIAIGAGVGFSIRNYGNGIDKIFGYFGAGISMFSVLLGNFFSIIGFIANAQGLGYIETLMILDINVVLELMVQTFSLMDIAFYGIAIYEGYKFSFRQITKKDILKINNQNTQNRET